MDGLRRVGKCWFIGRDSDGQPLVVIGPDWASFLVMFILVGAISGAFIFGLAWRISYEFQVIGILLFILAQGSYLLTAIANPGVGEISKASADSLTDPLLFPLYCRNCESYQPTNAVHCISCGVCVIDRDHHCPWVGKCIGRENSTFFSTFLSGLIALVIYILVCAVLVKSK